MSDQPIKYNSQIEKDEHDDSANIGGKRSILYGWNSSTLQYERVLSSNGVLQTSASLTGGSTTVTYNATPPTLTDGQSTTLQGDENGNLKISGSISATNPSVGSNTSSIPTSSTLIGTEDSSGKLQAVSSTNPLPISGSITASNPSVGTSGSAIPTSSTLLGASDGTNLQPLQVDSGNRLKVLVDNNSTGAILGRVNIFDSNNSNGAAVKGASTAAVATDPALVVAISPNNTVPVSGTFWQTTQPISASSLPLPSGAATSAKQPALGTAGSASSDVLTVQGITSMTPLKVDGSGVTQPVSGTFWQSTQPVSLSSLPALAAGSNLVGQFEVSDGTNVLGTSTHPVQVTLANTGSNSTAVKVDASSTTVPVSGTFWQATQPVSVASLPALASGSNVIGNVGIDQTTPGTTNGISLQVDTTSGWSFNYQSALSSTKAQIKGAAGKFGGFINLYNPNTAVTYIQVFNKVSANVTVGTTAPDFVITLPGVATASATGSDRNLEITMGLAMNTGITVVATTTPTGSTAPGNAVVGTFLFI